MDVWGITHRGAVRSQNQDSYAARTLPDGRIIALVCDGMGGAQAGNVASTMATELFLEEFQRPSPEEDGQRMLRAAGRANREVFRRSVDEPACAGMGTTLVAALAGNGMAVVLNEGDSRAYHIGKGIRQVTRDHSLVEDLIERGELTREQARTHPHKNLITRAVGAEEELMADCFRQPLAPGEFLLLCSDGLSNLFTDQELLDEVSREEPETCCERLLRLALDRGAPDNVTAVLIRG